MQVRVTDSDAARLKAPCLPRLCTPTPPHQALLQVSCSPGTFGPERPPKPGAGDCSFTVLPLAPGTRACSKQEGPRGVEYGSILHHGGEGKQAVHGPGHWRARLPGVWSHLLIECSLSAENGLFSTLSSSGCPGTTCCQHFPQ